MGFEDITNAITTQVASLMQSKNYTARYDNDPTATPKSGYWCHVSLSFGNADQIELGGGLFRKVGILTIQIVGPVNEGSKTFSTMADIIVAFFKNLTIGGYIKFRSPRIENVGRIGDNWNVNVLCPFHADEN